VGEAYLRKIGIGLLSFLALAFASCGEAPQKANAPEKSSEPTERSANREITPSAPDSEMAPGAGAPAPEASAPDSADQGEFAGEEPPMPKSAAPPPVGSSPPRFETRAPPSAEPPTAGGAAPPDPVGGSGPPPAGGSAPPDGFGQGAPPPAPAPPPPADAAKTEAGEWDVVPVYYGTDRTQAPNENRLDYGSERGRRLELGRALVTVPKAHKVPNVERPWAIKVFNITLYQEAEDPDRHFTMKEIKAMSEDELLAQVRERLAASQRYKDHAFIFIHGYNTSFDYALYRTAQIAYDLKFDGAPFAYSWPSGGGLASYTYDRESSGQSEPYLKKFMQMVIEKSGAKSVSIIAHSMGNQPTLQVLRDLRRSKPDHVQISQIVLAAPDVDRDNFENIVAEIQGLADGVTLYAAGNDRALRVSRNFYGGIPRAGDVPTTGPLVLPGIDTIDVSAASTDSFSLNHSGYAENNALLTDIGALIATGTRPPKLRTPLLDEITTEKGAYWKYPAKTP
jgi:esterase/lipase superfamily enzyme